MKTADTFEPRRTLLLDLFQVGLARVNGRRCVGAALGAAEPASPVWVAAIGKAATAMALGAYDALGGAIERTLIISRDPEDLSGFAAGPAPEVWLGSHPVPDERSLAAGARLLAWVDELPPSVWPLFLISGGASSLVEVPAPGATLEDLAALTRLSFTSGMAIGELNARRAALSCIKGGRLAARLGGRPARALFVSDVPNDDPRVIGSGLMGPAPGGTDGIERTVIASIDHAVAAVAAHAAQLGLTVHAPRERFAGSAERLAARFAHELHLGAAQLCVSSLAAVSCCCSRPAPTEATESPRMPVRSSMRRAARASRSRSSTPMIACTKRIPPVRLPPAATWCTPGRPAPTSVTS